MSAGGFDRDSAWSVFEALRPGPGQTVEKVSVATYSLDLVAVAGLLLALGASSEDEFQAGPLEFADAVRTLKSRVVIIHQKGRLKTPTRYRDILHLLDGMVRAANPEPAASWHPKAILARYGAARGGVSWRLWLGSRNLTGSRDREAGLILIGGAARSTKASETGRVLRSLFAGADWTPEQFLALDHVRWVAPAGVRFRGLRWRALGSNGHLVGPLPKARSVLAISPFVDDRGLAALPKAAERRLLTTSADLANLTPDDFQVRVAGPPKFDEPVATVDQDLDGTPAPFGDGGLHAKLVLQRSARVNRLSIGSANATGRGLIGPNAEVMAEIDVPDAYADALESLWERSPDAPEAAEADTEAATLRAAERRLDRALCALHDMIFGLSLEPAGLTLTASGSLDEFLGSHRLRVSLSTLDNAAREWVIGADAVVLAGPDLPVRLQTILVDFHVESRSLPPISRTWTQPVAFPGFNPADRDRAALAAYIGPSRFAAWLRAQIEGVEASGGETETWTGAPRSGAPARSGGALGRPFTLENVLAAWARDPDVFEQRIPEIDGVLRAYVDGLADLEEPQAEAARDAMREILTFWDALGSTLGLEGRHGDA